MAAIYSDLEGKVVLVTGGGSGIGEAIVRRFAEQKCKVGFIDIAPRGFGGACKRAGGEGPRGALRDTPT